MIEQEHSIDTYLEQADSVYQWMEDDQSKAIFQARLAFSKTESDSSLAQLLTQSSPQVQDSLALFEGRSVYDMNVSALETVVIYGAGRIGTRHVTRLQGRCRVLLCDRRYQELETTACPVISPDTLVQEHKDKKVVISAALHTKEIVQCLLDQGFSKEQLFFGSEADLVEQYFDSLVSFGEREIFVDCGGFDGANSLEFAKRCPNYKEIIIFEPDQANRRKIKQNFKEANLPQPTLKEPLLWHEKTTLSFATGNEDICVISETGNTTLQGDTIDHMVGDRAVTFLKMDIEGAELNGLKGAKNTILAHKPTLALSIYHKKEDILTLPLYLKSLVPEYKLYLRHYTGCEDDTVLYAILETKCNKENTGIS